MDKGKKEYLINAYLRLLMPVSIIYIVFICLNVYFSKPSDNKFLDVTVMFTCSFLMVFGLKALFTDLKRLGLFKTIKKFLKWEW